MQTINEASKAALGCALLDTKALDAVLELDAQDFEWEVEKEVFAAMKTLHAERKAVDLVSVDAATGGRFTSLLIEWSTGVAATTLVHSHIEIIKDSAKRRRLRAAATALYNGAGDSTKAIEELTAEFSRNIDSIAQIEGGTVSATDALLALVNGFDKKDTNKGLTGIPLLDKALGGLHGGRLYVIGARPATGKTALAISSAFTSSAFGTVLFCSYEMQPSEIMGRLMARLSRVNSQDISYRTLTEEQYMKLAEHYGKAGQLPIRFAINAETTDRVRAEALRLNKDNGLRLIVVDYLQLMSSGKRSESRRVEVGQISRALKRMALELDVPVLALSQLNRQSEGTASKVPTMSEMRESGDIEQDADAIILMYNPQDDNSRGFAETCEDNGYAPVRLLLDKNRQGKSGIAIDTAFDGSTMTFISKTAVMEG